MENDYLTSVKKQFAYYKSLGEKTFEQLSDQQLLWQYNPESNSVAMIVNHMAGNMISRWTDIFTSDGEKPTRNREAEFAPSTTSRQIILDIWEQGWKCLFDTLNTLTADDLSKIIYIRNQGHTVMEAINRQLAHYPYHVGQIVFLGKMLCNEIGTHYLCQEASLKTIMLISLPKKNAERILPTRNRSTFSPLIDIPSLYLPEIRALKNSN